MNNTKFVADANGRETAVANLRHWRLHPEEFLPIGRNGSSPEWQPEWQLLMQIKLGWERLDANLILSALNEEFMYWDDKGHRLDLAGYRYYLPISFDAIQRDAALCQVDLVVIYESLYPRCFPYALRLVFKNATRLLTFGFNNGKASVLYMADPDMFTYEPTFAKGGILQEEGLPRVFDCKCHETDRSRRMTDAEAQYYAVQIVTELFKEARAEVLEPDERFCGNIPCVITKCGPDVYYHWLSLSFFNMKTGSNNPIGQCDEEMIREFSSQAQARGAWPMIMDVSFANMLGGDEPLCGDPYCFRVREAMPLI